ncbi:gp28 [Burkholderia sp. YI23]|nr:gp28 [Burkholderia sp. YI23]
MSIKYYGAPMPQANQAVSKAAVAHAASGPADDGGAAATVQTLTQALAAQGVTAEVTPVTMTATALHDLVMSTNGGVRPTNDDLAKANIKATGYAVVNFQLDDMVTSRDDPAQAAALEQFKQDLITFIQQQHLDAKWTFILTPIPTCDLPVGHTAADGLSEAEAKATSEALAFMAGEVPSSAVAQPNGDLINTSIIGHMGADCRTPDAYIVDHWTQTAAARMALSFNASPEK